MFDVVTQPDVQLAGQWLGPILTVVGIGLSIFSIFRAFSQKTKIVGARLEDRKIQVSTYGNVVKRLYGCDRLAGNVIWSTEMREVRTKETSGGKGGGGVETITFTYFVDCAVSFGTSFTPDTTDVLRIWFDADLVVAKTPPTDPMSLETIAAFAASGTLIRFYRGSEDQEPDPLMQAALGIDDTPAYRGQMVIVFENLNITPYGRIPNITAEICTNAADAFPVESGGTISINNIQPLYNPTNNSVYFVRNTLGTLRVIRYDRATGETQETSISDPLDGQGAWIGGAVDSLGFVWTGGTQKIGRIDPDSFSVTVHALPALASCSDPTPIFAGQANAITSVPRVGFPDAMIAYTGIAARGNWYVVLPDVGVTNYGLLDTTDPASVAIYTRNGYVWGGIWDFNPASTRAELFYQFFPEEALVGCSAIPIPTKFDVSATIRHIQGIGRNPEGTELYVLGIKPGASTGRLVAFDISGLIPSVSRILDETDIPNGGIATGIYGDSKQLHQIHLNGWPVFVGHGGTTWTKIDLRTFSIIKQYDQGDYQPDPEYPAGFVIFSTMFDPVYNSLFLTGNNGAVIRVFFDRATHGTVTLRQIVEDVSTLVNLDVANDVDATTLTDIVRGTTFTQRAPAASHLEPLLGAYIVDATESDWKVEYVKRGSRSHLDLPAFMQTINQQYLGAKEEEGQDYVLERKMIQDRERPRRIDIRYIDQDQDYQEGDQSSVRTVLPEPTMFSIAESSTELPIVFLADEAKQVAESWLQLAWSETQALELVALPRFLLLDPTDVVIVESPSGTDLVRIEEYEFGADLGIEMKSVTHVVPASILGGAPSLGFIPSIIPTIGTSTTTTAEILDVTLLRDQDAFTNGTGVYIALQTQTTPWPGANVFVSTDNVAFSAMASGTVSAVWGRTENALPAPEHYTVWDDVNTVDVFLPNGETLSNAADDLAVLAGANPAIIGNEVIQYRDATVDPGDSRRYTLSRLLRGRRGSNTFMAHGAGERFVALSASTILREDLQLSDINAIRYFKTVTFGGSLALAPSRSLLYMANDLKPYSPAHIRGERDGSNNLTIRWLRRTRIGGDLGWTNPAVNGNAPLSEASERYEVEILSAPSGSVLRTISSDITISGTPATDGFNGSVVYSAAQQAADSIVPGSPVTVRIYQMSELVGRGFPAERTLL